MTHLPNWLRQHLAALRMVVVSTAVLGIGYPLAVTLVAQLPGLHHHADGSLVRLGGKVIGSDLVGQSFTDTEGQPVERYFQSRPSTGGYDSTSTGASNLGPESIIGADSLLSQVCTRSREVGEENGVDGRRPYCTADGLGAVLSVIRRHGTTGQVVKVVSVNQACPATPFIPTYDGVSVTCATHTEDIALGTIVPIRGPGKAWPDNPVPPDAVTASGSGIDPDISLAYAELQAPRVARARGLALSQVTQLIKQYTSGRTLGFMGEPAVNVLQLNLALARLSGL
jgi:K+-transporting ATPase ATPase C chain